jgi:hypothetical protein
VEIDVEAAGLAVQGSYLAEEGYTDALEVAGVMLMARLSRVWWSRQSNLTKRAGRIGFGLSYVSLRMALYISYRLGPGFEAIPPPQNHGGLLFADLRVNVQHSWSTACPAKSA